MTRPGRRFIDVIRQIDELFVKHDLMENRLTGYAHGVGLQPEGCPVVTIVPAHRALEVSEGENDPSLRTHTINAEGIWEYEVRGYLHSLEGRA